MACAALHCIVGGGEISPDVSGWAHISSDGAQSWTAQRALSAPYPVRSVLAVPTLGTATPILIAAGGNFFSSCGGVYSSSDGGRTWSEDIDLGEEVKACRAVAIPAIGVSRVFCVSAGNQRGSIISADIPS